jgi:ubiquinone/menaquinone biosynthesis C-methylase UbiE
VNGEAYHQTRLPYDRRREILWRALWKFHFSRYITSSDCVLELGCGYADFINNVQTRRRIALDSWPGFLKYLAKDVEGHIGDATDLSFLERASVDFAFASNVFEHLTKENLSSVLSQLSEKLTIRGKLAILQPNYRYAYKEYFDDYTHVSVYSHESLCDFLAAHNYQVIECIPRFMPLTVKNRRMIVSESLIRLYLSLPMKPLGKQMFVIARPITQSVQPA